MGTRHLIMAIVDGQTKLAQYGQWDGYPSGQGDRVCKFIDRLRSEPMAIPTFKDKLRQCSFLTREEIKKINEENKGKGDVCDWEDWSHLSRDQGAKILDLVMDSEHGLKLVDRTSFAADSLFCEYAYVLDMDNLALEFYTGFNQDSTLAGERFMALKREPDSKYYAVTLRGTIPFRDAPTVKMLEALEPKEE